MVKLRGESIHEKRYEISFCRHAGVDGLFEKRKPLVRPGVQLSFSVESLI